VPNPHSRRAFLRAALAVTSVAATTGLAGCDVLGGTGPGGVPPHQLDGFLNDTVALRDLYQAAITAVPALEAALAPVRDAHGAHAVALADALGRAMPTGGAAPSVATIRSEAIAALVAAEKAGREQAAKACLEGPGRLAPLLGSMTAARATHLEVVR